MSHFVVLFVPFIVLLPAAGAVGIRPEPLNEAAIIPAAMPEENYAPSSAAGRGRPEFPEGTPFAMVAEAFRAQTVNQVRIDQQTTIRISPRPQPVRPNLLMDLPGREIAPRLEERKMGKCLKVKGIAGVQPNGGSRLLLFMRDRRIVSAQLERACRSRDFYSGFYLSRSTDGKLCVDRDTLLSRSGANCRLTRIRQLVESDD